MGKHMEILSNENEELKIDLGCGTNKKKGFKGIDLLPLEGVDYVINLEEGLKFIGDNIVDEFFTSHFLEHIENLDLILSEIHRTLKPTGKCVIIVPHFSNPYFYSDYTHKRFFGLYTFDYFSVSDKRYKRKVPKYNTNFTFKVEERKLVFRSPSFKLFNLIRKHIYQNIFNASPRMREIYEGLFTNLFSCTELHFILKPIK